VVFIAARDNSVVMSWFGFSDLEADIYNIHSDDSGTTWSPFNNLTAQRMSCDTTPASATGADRASSCSIRS
jgi:hypothetical protein